MENIITERNIDGLSDYEIIQVINSMFTYANTMSKEQYGC